MTDSSYQTAGTISGFATSLLFYPLDTYKSRIQSGLYTNKGLYKGCLPELASNTFSSFVYWGVYQTSRNNGYTPVQSVCYSSIISNLIDSPLDYIKKHRQLGYTISTNPSTFFRYSLLNCGYSLVYNLTYMSILSSTYTQKDKTSHVSTLIGCSAVATTVSYPIDYYRTRVISFPNIQYPPVRMGASSFWKGYFARLLYSTTYSTCYMKIFLILTSYSF